MRRPFFHSISRPTIRLFLLNLLLGLVAVVSLTMALKVDAGATDPIILNLSPASGLVRGGTTVSIDGDNFIGVTAISFDGIKASSFRVDSARRITAVTPAHKAGPVDVTLISASGKVTTLSSGFNYFTVVSLPPTPTIKPPVPIVSPNPTIIVPTSTPNLATPTASSTTVATTSPSVTLDSTITPITSPSVTLDNTTVASMSPSVTTGTERPIATATPGVTSSVTPTVTVQTSATPARPGRLSPTPTLASSPTPGISLSPSPTVTMLSTLAPTTANSQPSRTKVKNDPTATPAPIRRLPLPQTTIRATTTPMPTITVTSTLPSISPLPDPSPISTTVKAATGGLNITSQPTNIIYSGQLNGEFLVLNSTFSITIEDSTGAMAGWHLMMSSEPLRSDRYIIPAQNYTIQKITTTQANATAPKNTVNYPMIIPINSATIFSAAENTGMGQITLTLQTQLLIPAEALAGNYKINLSFTLFPGS